MSVPTTLDGNEAIESIVNNGDGTLTITFKDPIPDDVAEGAYAIKITANQVEGTVETPITWVVGGEEDGITIKVEEQVTPPVEVQDSYAKSVNPSNLNNFVQTTGAPNYQLNGLNPNIADQVITYTLVLGSSEARTGYAITDTVDAGLSFVAGSFTATITTADGTENVTFAPTVTGNTFSGTIDVPEQSTLRITYEVKVTDIAALEAALQAKYDERNDINSELKEPGNYSIKLTNSATFGEDSTKSVDVTLTGNVPGVGVGNNFGKSGNWNLRDVITNEDGSLATPAEMTYTLHADLTPWNEQNANFTLSKNVVISDVLIDQASWKTGAGFISVSGAGPITELSRATGFEGTVAEFAANEYVGQYALIGQTLLVNVGKDKTTNIDIAVKAELNTVEGLPQSGGTNVIDGTHYQWNNKANFHYRDGDPAGRDFNAGVVDLPDNYEEGVNDSDAFNKAAVNGEVSVRPGESAQVPYRFTINAAKGDIDPLNSRIVDEVDASIFDLSNLDAIAVSGSYNGQALNREHFALSLDDDGHLVIQLNDAGKALVEAQPVDRVWVVDLTLTTIPFDGKQTFELYNRAQLLTDGSEWDYWSETNSVATSYGDEAELRKRVFDETATEWTEQLNAGIQDGEFIDPRFVYSIELIPRGNYGKDFPVKAYTREDVLPDSVEFLGFVTVDENGVPNLDSFENGPINLNGNIEASYADGVVTVSQKAGTNLDVNNGRIVTYFAVRGVDASSPIVNNIKDTPATAVIEPVGDPSIDIEKWNDEGEAPAYDETGALTNDGFEGDFDEAPGKPLAANAEQQVNFTISNDGREDLVDIVVSDELTGGKGTIENLVCTFVEASDGVEAVTGTEWAGPFAIGTQFECTGTLPALESGDTHANLASVTGTGDFTGEEVSDEDEWNAYVPVPSIDIEKWIDEGESPEYDETGALTNGGFKGDYDKAPGKELKAGQSEEIRFTVSNDGEEPLVNIVVSDELVDGKGKISDFVCTFVPASGEGDEAVEAVTGTEWDGPLYAGEQFECEGTLPALQAGDNHANTAKVTAVGMYSGTDVDDADDWFGKVPAAALVNTGGQSLAGLGLLGGLGLIAGAVLLVLRRRATKA